MKYQTVDLTLQSGLQLIKNKQYQDVHTHSITMIQKDINNPLAYFLLGVIASEHANHLKALELFEKASALDILNVYYHAHRAKTLSTLRRQNEAKSIADLANKFEISDAFISDTIGVVYSRSGYHEKAIPLFEKAVALDPTLANFHYNLGASAQFTGDFKKAKTAYQNTLSLDAGFYRARSSLIALSTQTEDNHQLGELMPSFDAADGDADAQLQLGHAIAKTLEDLDQYPESLDWLLKAKKAKRDQLRFDRKSTAQTFAAAKKFKPSLTSLSDDTSQFAPIFIVGLPRTGTTLVDRILSSHTDVASAGELNIFAELIKEKAGTQSNLVMDADTFLKAPELDLAAIGKAYFSATKDLSRGAMHMVDKMPLNFFYAGLIHQALPNARIIALRRGAMDSCLSNFRQLFSTQHSYYDYTFDLEDTAYFYQKFDDLMAHWRATLPANFFMEIHYEDIVLDQKNQTQRLLEFCGLGWEEACMRFHENLAPVATASSVQVRKPLYSGSIGRWKKYGDTLNPLHIALGQLSDKP